MCILACGELDPVKAAKRPLQTELDIRVRLIVLSWLCNSMNEMQSSLCVLCMAHVQSAL